MIDASQIEVGDVCEFESDRQTEKGPCSGVCIEADESTVVIRHSDHPGESFERDSLIVNYACNKPKTNKCYWLLA